MSRLEISIEEYIEHLKVWRFHGIAEELIETIETLTSEI